MPSFYALAARRAKAKARAAEQASRLVELLGIEAPEPHKTKNTELRLVVLMEYQADLLEAANAKLEELGVGQN